ncbi:helix-turn-helix domain-containing protein [Nocardia huaxiensis]|uniref:Helix-turn-helix domain-containing protein n=1 Tax=Nocardia huaxiensis TaxID=2755382 RepID=A0A7D6ZP48_9NOCA|nr:PucR family transcriptional regulator [Nocardia huaxiensis]QLY30125.1 helix-turn-helix domain-containing protein [Nocardia huaxiensis]
MRVRDILEAPQLRMRLLHGDPTALDRPVARVCATDMPDPRPFVTAGALVCTGLVWRSDAPDSDRYVGMLARAGAAGVVAGQALHGHVPDDVVAACERHQLPLLSAPQSVPFSRIIEYLADRAADRRWQRVQSGLDRQRRLLAAVAAGADIAELLTEVAAEQEVSAWILTATGRVVAGTAPLSELDIDRIVTTALTAPMLPAVTGGATRIHQIGHGDRITAWYLAIRPAGNDSGLYGPDLAAVLELYRQRDADRLRLSWELAGNASALFARHSGPAVVAVVCDLHIDTSIGPGPLAGAYGQDAIRSVLHDVLAVATSATPFGSASDRRLTHPESASPGVDVATVEATPHEISDAAGRMLGAAARQVSTALDREGRIVAVVGGTQAGVATELRTRIGRLVSALDGIRIAIGVSAPQPGEALQGAVAAAGAAATAARDGESAVTVRAADIDSAIGLFAAVPGALQHRFAQRVLGPVVEYDARTGAGLLPTLEVFLACEGSWRQAAERMHLHLNTVRYRIGRIEELTGRDLGRLDDRLDLYLAMRTLSGPTASGQGPDDFGNPRRA